MKKLCIAFSLIIVALVGCDRLGGSVGAYGYDVVAYFEEGAAVEGNERTQAMYEGKQYYFSKPEYKELFENNPEKYLPAYEGYCAYGVAVNNLIKSDPTAWTIYEGKLYLNVSHKVKGIWEKDIPGYLRKSEGNWPGLKK